MSLIERDLKHIWHPCSQMKDYEAFSPLDIVGATGCELHLREGRRIIDAISSWWCKSLGHQHPRLKAAAQRQIERFEHVILANTTNEVIVSLSEKLAQLSQGLNKVFYAGDGSSAVEIALKMSLHSRRIAGDAKRTQFIALTNGYHGETTGALSVSDLGMYRDPYQAMLFQSVFIAPPYVQGEIDPGWQACEWHWQAVVQQLEKYEETATAIIVEPIVQGAGGMKIYSPDFLRRLRAWSAKHGIHLIADECMTGLGHTGKMLACEHASIQPDIVCLSKGLTSGWLPFSAVLMSQNLYDIFYDDYNTGKSFLHSHTYSGNALGAAIALETLTILEEENICVRAAELGVRMRVMMQDIAAATRQLTNVRGVGAVIAADLIVEDPNERRGFEVYQHAVRAGALLRPLGNTIYWVPPLNINESTLARLAEATQVAVGS